MHLSFTGENHFRFSYLPENIATCFNFFTLKPLGQENHEERDSAVPGETRIYALHS